MENTGLSLLSRFKKTNAYWFLLAATLILPVSNGRWILAPMAWLAPIFLLRFTRRVRRPWLGFLAAWLVLVLTGAFSWFGLIPFPPSVFVTVTLTEALFALLPYMIDRYLHERLTGLLSTLPFPASAVTFGFLFTLHAETTWAQVAYTQTAFLPLLQLASVAGLWGITFLIYWTASVVNWIWEQPKAGVSSRQVVIPYATVFGLVLFFGVVRMAGFAPEGSKVKVVTLTPPEMFERLSLEELGIFQQHFMRQEVDQAQLQKIQQALRDSNDELLRQTRELNQPRARYVFWPEGAVLAFSDAEHQQLIESARAIAREKQIFLGMAMAVILPEPDRLHENKVLLIDPTGEIVNEYHKTQLVPYVEEPFTQPGTAQIIPSTTSDGKVASVICYDMDNPRFLEDAGNNSVDILFAPSSDWEAIKTLHHRMALFRAVEQGFNLVRPANHGLSATVDYQGRVLASIDHFSTDERILVAEVPTKGTRTIYSQTGDLFAWCCMVLLLGVAIMGICYKRRLNQEIQFQE
jgi:apolipoprotein N-acyltransferase